MRLARLARPASQLTLLVALTACGGGGVAVQSAQDQNHLANSKVTVQAPPAFPQSFDPVMATTSADAMKKHCDSRFEQARAIIEELRSAKGKAPAALTFENTALRLDDITTLVMDATGIADLMMQAHPDAAVREAATACSPEADKLLTSLFLDADIALVLRNYAWKKEALTGERARLLENSLRDFRRNGLELPADKQEQLRKLNEQITALGQTFQTNINASTGSIEVGAKSLDGLPKDYVAKHPLRNGKAQISTDYPDYFPFVTHSKDRSAALDLYVKFTNRGGDANVKLIDQLIELRHKKAQLLGYESWADYMVEPRMAKSSKNVREFLTKVKEAVKGPAAAEFADFVREHVSLGGKANDKLPPPERMFLEDRVKAKKFKFDSTAIAEYFPVTSVVDGLLAITAKMYSLEYKKVEEATWHSDVATYEVFSKGAKIGKFYLDLYPRADKFKHAAMFGMVSGKRLQDGTYRMPVAALECNFPKPSADGSSPATLTHDEVTTFFHEFGHVLHHLLATSELGTFSGANTVQDFVEAPSQMFEEWAWSREVLDLFAHHYKTGAKIPDALFKGLVASRSFGLSLSTQRQLFLATLDFEYHSRTPGFDSTKVLAEIQDSTDSFAYVPNTHMQSSFGHLVGYDAGYYSYQWALSLSRDILTRFQKEGLLNPTTAAAWRDLVLSKGGGTDERANVAAFLGREPNHDAYIHFITGR